MEEIRGVLGVGVLPEILRRIFVARRSGTLHLALGGDSSELEFHDGYLGHANTTLPGAGLGDLLVQSGFLSLHDRDACLEIAALSHERPGDTLVRHGLLATDQLTQGLGLQLREILARTLVWKGGVYSFTDSAPTGGQTPGGAMPPRLDPREVMLDATWTLVGDPALDGILGDLRQKLRAVSEDRFPYLDVRLTPADAFLLSRVDGEMTAENLLQLSPLATEEAKASLAGLLAVGAIEYVDVPPPTLRTTETARSEVARLAHRLESSDPCEVFGVGPDVSTGELRSTYVRLLRLCAPSGTADQELRAILRRMSNQLNEAFKIMQRRRATSAPPTVPPAERRRPATPKESVLPATPVLPAVTAAESGAPAHVAMTPAIEPAQAIEAAAGAFEAGRLHEALVILHEAIPRLEGRARRSARVQKARFLLSAENGSRLAEEELKRALVEDPGNAPAHAALGEVYRERGSVALAMMEYGKVLELEPRNAGAREALQRLRAVPQEKPPEVSVLRRFFRR